MKLAELTWPDVEKADRNLVVIAPIAALEQHSRHLPFFTDSILCEAVVSRLEAAIPNDVLLLPVQWLGASSHHLGMAGTLTVENETYLRLLSEPLRCLLKSGFCRVFIVNGHGGNIDGYHLALRQLAIEFPKAFLCGASYWDLAQNEIPNILEGTRKSVGHACEFETSMMMYLRPELVVTGEIADDELKKQSPKLKDVYIPLDMKLQTNQGGTGQPTLATSAKGEALLNLIVERAIETTKAIRTQASP